MKLKLLTIAFTCAVLTFTLSATNLVSAYDDSWASWDCNSQNSQNQFMPYNSYLYGSLGAYYDDDYIIYYVDCNVAYGGMWWWDGWYESVGEIMPEQEPYTEAVQCFEAVQFHPYNDYAFYAYIWLWHYPSYTQNPSHEEGDWQYGFPSSTLLEDLMR